MKEKENNMNMKEIPTDKLTSAIKSLFKPGTVLYNIIEGEDIVVEITSEDKGGIYRTMKYKIDLFEKILDDVKKLKTQSNDNTESANEK